MCSTVYRLEIKIRKKYYGIYMADVKNSTLFDILAEMKNEHSNMMTHPNFYTDFDAKIHTEIDERIKTLPDVDCVRFGCLNPTKLFDWFGGWLNRICEFEEITICEYEVSDFILSNSKKQLIFFTENIKSRKEISLEELKNKLYN